jgi:ABC transporter DrrB family efflux protein
MSSRGTFATARRVLMQLRHDPRTIALLLIVPVALVTLMKWIFSSQDEVFQRIGVPLLGVFPMTSMFLVTSIAMLRERITGTLERLMTMPIAKLDLIAGYALSFGSLAFVQAALVSLVAFGPLGLNIAGSPFAVLLIALLNALFGTALGLFTSAFASTEFQAVQFMPVVLLPQILLCGLLTPRANMARPLELFSNVLPMTYAYDALSRVAQSGGWSGRIGLDVMVLIGATMLALALGATTLPRRTP